MKIDKEHFLARLYASGYGTGTLAQATGIPPDEIQKMIATGEAPIDQVQKIQDRIGDGWISGQIEESPVEPEPEPAAFDYSAPQEVSIEELKRLVEEGSVDEARLLEAEESQEAPRITLIRWLEDRLNA